MMLIEAKRSGEMQRRFRSLERVELLLIDELGYIPFEREATDLLFNVISARYERASVAITTNWQRHDLIDPLGTITLTPPAD